MDYKLGRLRFLRENDAYHHLATVHDDDANNEAGAFDKLTDFRTDQEHSKLREKILTQRQRREWPVANVEFGYEQGLVGPEDFVGRAWEVAMAGGYTAYYYTYTAWDVLRPRDTPQGYNYFKQLRDFFESTRYWELSSVKNVMEEGWTLANPRNEHVIYVKQAKPFQLNLEAATKLKGEWFNPLTNKRVKAEKIKSGSQEMRPPDGWEGGVVLHLSR